jgi:hypothetical protein
MFQDHPCVGLMNWPYGGGNPNRWLENAAMADCSALS